MGINKNVFASRSERENFYKLSRTWGDKYRIYHNLPFLTVFTISGLVDITAGAITAEPITVDSIGFNRLKKTSIDYTLCNDEDTPLVCIEFDGMQQGVNVGAVYHPGSGYPSNEWRQKILELKLTVAQGSLFPFFVVGSSLFGDISSEIQLTIVDGLIGEVLAGDALKRKFAEDFDPRQVGMSRQEFSNLHPDARQATIDWWIDLVETESRMESNPITRKKWELWEELGRPSWEINHFFPQARLRLNRKSGESTIEMIKSEVSFLVSEELWSACEIVMCQWRDRNPQFWRNKIPQLKCSVRVLMGQRTSVLAGL